MYACRAPRINFYGKMAAKSLCVLPYYLGYRVGRHTYRHARVAGFSVHPKKALATQAPTMHSGVVTARTAGLTPTSPL